MVKIILIFKELHNWKHENRWECQEVCEGIFLGPYNLVKRAEVIIAHNIKYIILTSEALAIKILMKDRGSEFISLPNFSP